MKPLSLDDAGSLILFAKVVELQSFSAAARELGLAKSAVSKRISQLEKKMGVCLLVRSTRKVTPSESGVQLFQYCASMQSSLYDVASALEYGDSGDRGVIRMNAPGLFIERQLIPVINRYSDTHKDLQFDLSSDDSMIGLTDGRYDLVIRIASEINEQSIVGRPIATDRLVIVGAPDYFSKYGTPQTPEELGHHCCMRYTPRSSNVEWRFTSNDKPYYAGVSSTLSAGDDAALRSAAIAGMGLAIMPRCFVNDELESGQLETVLEECMWKPERTIYALLPEGRLAPSRVRRFVAELSELLKHPQ